MLDCSFYPTGAKRGFRHLFQGRHQKLLTGVKIHWMIKGTHFHRKWHNLDCTRWQTAEAPWQPQHRPFSHGDWNSLSTAVHKSPETALLSWRVRVRVTRVCPVSCGPLPKLSENKPLLLWVGRQSGQCSGILCNAKLTEWHPPNAIFI